MIHPYVLDLAYRFLGGGEIINTPLLDPVIAVPRITVPLDTEFLPSGWLCVVGPLAMI